MPIQGRILPNQTPIARTSPAPRRVNRLNPVGPNETGGQLEPFFRPINAGRVISSGAGAGAPTYPGLADPFMYKKGGKVKKSGIAYVHKGEEVIPAKKAKEPQKYAGTKNMMGGGRKTPKKAKTGKILESVGHELKVNPPKVLAKTRKAKGAKQANKQRVAILLSKTRRAGGKV